MRICSICGSETFDIIGNLPSHRCTGCGSFERTRYLWSFLTSAQRLNPGLRMLHVAPEKALSLKIREIVGDSYTPADYDPSRYAIEGLTVEKIDLTRMNEIEGASFDLILHLHVLEHIPMDLGQLLVEHIRVLKPGGRFIFALPIGPGITYENIWPDATPAERKERFGQHDHVRLVGKLDFPRFLKRVAGAFTGQEDFRINPDDYMSRQDLDRAGLAYARVMGYTGDTLFEIVKPGRSN